MSKNKELQHTTLAVVTIAALFVLSLFFSKSTDISTELLGTGYLYYSLLQFELINPLIVNLFLIFFIGLSVSITTLALLRYSNSSPYSAFFAIIYCLNPWLLYYQGDVRICLIYLLHIPLTLLLLQRKSKHEKIFGIGIIIAISVLILPFSIFIFTPLIAFGSLLSGLKLSRSEILTLLCTTISALLIHLIFINSIAVTDVAVNTALYTGLNISTYLSLFDAYYISSLFQFLPTHTDLVPRLPIGLVTIAAIYFMIFRLKISKQGKYAITICIIILLAATGPTLYTSFNEAVPMLMPYILVQILTPFIYHFPDTLIFLCGLLIITMLNAAFGKQQENNNKHTIIHILVIVILFVQIIPLPILSSSIYHFQGYEKLTDDDKNSAILEFNDLEQNTYNAYRLQRYREHRQLTVSNTAPKHKEIVNLLSGKTKFIPQNTNESYNSLLRQGYNISILDDIYCSQPFLNNEPAQLINNNLTSLPLDFTVVHQDKCHSLVSLSPSSWIDGILLFNGVDSDKRRILRNEKLKIIDNTKLHYVNLTDKPQTVTVNMTVSSTKNISTTLALKKKKTESIYIKKNNPEKNISFSFIANPREQLAITFILKNSNNKPVTKNLSKNGLQIGNINYSIINKVTKTNDIKLLRQNKSNSTNITSEEINSITSQEIKNMDQMLIDEIFEEQPVK